MFQTTSSVSVVHDLKMATLRRKRDLMGVNNHACLPIPHSERARVKGLLSLTAAVNARRSGFRGNVDLVVTVYRAPSGSRPSELNGETAAARSQIVRRAQSQ